MNQQETGGVLAILSATWPHYELPDETAAVWATQLTRVLVADALEAAGELARHSKFFPSISEFVIAAQAAARRRAADAHARQLPCSNEPYVTQTEGAAWVRRVRQTIAAAPKPPHVDDEIASIGETMTEQFTK